MDKALLALTPRRAKVMSAKPEWAQWPRPPAPHWSYIRIFLGWGSFCHPHHQPMEKGLPIACQGFSMKPPGRHPVSPRAPGGPRFGHTYKR